MAREYGSTLFLASCCLENICTMSEVTTLVFSSSGKKEALPGFHSPGPPPWLAEAWGHKWHLMPRGSHIPCSWANRECSLTSKKYKKTLTSLAQVLIHFDCCLHPSWVRSHRKRRLELKWVDKRKQTFFFFWAISLWEDGSKHSRSLSHLILGGKVYIPLYREGYSHSLSALPRRLCLLPNCSLKQLKCLLPIRNALFQN